MKLIQAKRDDLLKPLHAVSGIVEKRHTLPILSNVLIERTADTLLLLATDLEIQVSTRFDSPQKGSENYSVTASARKLLDILKALPDEAAISLEALNNRMQVRSGKSRFNLQTLPAEDFPKLTQAGTTTQKITTSQKLLRALLLQVQYAMAQQDIRYYLNGMLLVLDEDVLKAVATDGHRLAYASIKLQQKTELQEVILPRKTIQELIKLLTDTDDEVAVEFTTNQAKFTLGPMASSPITIA
jgi:DNA polymerase-3 subunit beta